MKANRTWLSLTLALPCFAFGLQESAPEESGLRLVSEGAESGLQRVFAPDVNPTGAVDRESWSQRLTDSDLDQREAALDELIARAHGDDHLRLMLEEWAVDPSQSERAWTARMALREVNRAAAPRALPGFPGGSLRTGRAGLFDLQRELEDVLLRSDDPHFGGWLESFSKDLDSIFAQTTPGCVDESKCFSLEVAPDGVHCELFECIDGQQVKKEYHADTYEELLKANPELREHVGNGVVPKVPGLDFGHRILAGLDKGLVDLDHAVPNRSDRLGIQTSAPLATRAKKLGLDEGQGLVVMRVLPRSLASVLDIRRGDLVIEIDGFKIFDGADVRRVLSERDEKSELRVVVINVRGQRRELVWKPNF